MQLDVFFPALKKRGFCSFFFFIVVRGQRIGSHPLFTHSLIPTAVAVWPFFRRPRVDLIKLLDDYIGVKGSILTKNF
jgi:hypothetical protein